MTLEQHQELTQAMWEDAFVDNELRVELHEDADELVLELDRELKEFVSRNPRKIPDGTLLFNVSSGGGVVKIAVVDGSETIHETRSTGFNVVRTKQSEYEVRL